LIRDDTVASIVLLGDAECQEGSVWESAMFASHNNLNNLIAITDRNWLGVIDYTERAVGLEPLEDKWRSFGWDVRRINGHNFSEIFEVLHEFRSFKRKKPLMIVADTIKGKGISFMEGVPIWHYRMPKPEELKTACADLGISENELTALMEPVGGKLA